MMRNKQWVLSARQREALTLTANVIMVLLFFLSNIVALIAYADVSKPAAEEHALILAQAGDPVSRNIDFDHSTTRFPLVGAHMNVRCETCHARGIFRGTPLACANCHIQGSGIATTFKPYNHIPTTATCDTCHNTNTWSGVRFNHSMVTPGTCVNCHNGSMASGKIGNHIPTTLSCDHCHMLQTWSGGRFDHAGVTSGCFMCHNGVMAQGAPAVGHPGGTNPSCELCHSFALGKF